MFIASRQCKNPAPEEPHVYRHHRHVAPTERIVSSSRRAINMWPLCGQEQDALTHFGRGQKKAQEAQVILLTCASCAG